MVDAERIGHSGRPSAAKLSSVADSNATLMALFTARMSPPTAARRSSASRVAVESTVTVKMSATRHLVHDLLHVIYAMRDLLPLIAVNVVQPHALDSALRERDLCATVCFRS